MIGAVVFVLLLVGLGLAALFAGLYYAFTTWVYEDIARRTATRLWLEEDCEDDV